MTRRTLLSSLPAALFAEVRKPRLRTAICAYSFRTQLQAKSMKYEDLIPLAVETNADGLDLTVSTGFQTRTTRFCFRCASLLTGTRLNFTASRYAAIYASRLDRPVIRRLRS